MSLVADLRKQLDAIIALQRRGETAQALAVAEQARDALAADPLLTTGKVRDLLGVRSVNTVKSTSRAGNLPFELRGNRMRIRHSAVERAMESEATRPMRRLEEAHAETAVLGHDGPLTEADHDELDADAGELPWRR